MKKEKLFRTRLFGGFNKSDVENYISELEKELENRENVVGSSENIGDELIQESINEIKMLRDKNDQYLNRIRELESVILTTHNDGEEVANEQLMKENQMLKEQLEDLQRNSTTYMQNKDTILRVLQDAKTNAEGVIQKANEEADEIRKRMEHELEVEKKQIYDTMRKEYEKKIVDMITVKYHLEDYVKEVENMQNHLGGIADSLKVILHGLPDGMTEFLEEDKFIENSYSKLSKESLVK